MRSDLSLAKFDGTELIETALAGSNLDSANLDAAHKLIMVDVAQVAIQRSTRLEKIFLSGAVGEPNWIGRESDSSLLLREPAAVTPPRVAVKKRGARQRSKWRLRDLLKFLEAARELGNAEMPTLIGKVIADRDASTRTVLVKRAIRGAHSGQQTTRRYSVAIDSTAVEAGDYVQIEKIQKTRGPNARARRGNYTGQYGQFGTPRGKWVLKRRIEKR
ncbi:hypothetical protein LJR296_003381 [Cupriavidus necator]|uniref:hypothetical protein n=1 Tax=Cupriavidus necator TaxID=106590 RepID=UPI003ECEDEF3